MLHPNPRRLRSCALWAAGVAAALAGVWPLQGARADDDLLRVAVIELKNNADLRAREVSALTESARGVVAERLGDKFMVMTKENIFTLVDAQACDAALGQSCEVEMGRTLGAHYIVSGAITRLGGKLHVSLKVHSTRDARLLGVRESNAGAAGGLLRAVRQAAAGAASTLRPPKTKPVEAVAKPKQRARLSPQNAKAQGAVRNKAGLSAGAPVPTISPRIADLPAEDGRVPSVALEGRGQGVDASKTPQMWLFEGALRQLALAFCLALGVAGWRRSRGGSHAPTPAPSVATTPASSPAPPQCPTCCGTGQVSVQRGFLKVKQSCHSCAGFGTGDERQAAQRREFDIFANVTASATPRPFEKGSYLVIICACTYFYNRKRQPLALVSCSVLESDNPDFPRDCMVSWVVSLDSDSGPSTIKTFICDVTGAAAHTLTPKDINEAFIAPGAHGISRLAGTKALVNVYEKTTEKNTIFTKCEWKAFEEGRDKRPDFSRLARPMSLEQPPLERPALEEAPPAPAEVNPAKPAKRRPMTLLKKLYIGGAVAFVAILGWFVAILGWVVAPNLRSAAPPESVHVSVSSTPPGAHLFLDDLDTGLKTPAVLSGVKLDVVHQLRLERKGYESVKRDMRWTADECEREKGRLSVREALTRSPGLLVVLSDPDGAEVFLNNEPLGKTPLMRRGVTREEGELMLLVRHPRFEQPVREVWEWGDDIERRFNLKLSGKKKR